MSDPRPSPRSLTSFSQSGKKFSDKSRLRPDPKREWSMKLEMPKQGTNTNSQQLHSNLGSLQPGFERNNFVKLPRVSHPKVEIPQALVPMTADDEDIPLSKICELIRDLPELVKAQIMKYQRIAEQNRPTRFKINSEFQRIVTLQAIVIGNNETLLLYPSFIKFMKKHFPLDLVETHSKMIEMSETRRNVIGWMYQFERTFCKHPCIRSFNY